MPRTRSSIRPAVVAGHRGVVGQCSTPGPTNTSSSTARARGRGRRRSARARARRSSRRCRPRPAPDQRRGPRSPRSRTKRLIADDRAVADARAGEDDRPGADDAPAPSTSGAGLARRRDGPRSPPAERRVADCSGRRPPCRAGTTCAGPSSPARHRRRASPAPVRRRTSPAAGRVEPSLQRLEHAHDAQPAAPSDSGVRPSRTHSTKCSHSIRSGSRLGTRGLQMSPERVMYSPYERASSSKPLS